MSRVDHVVARRRGDTRRARVKFENAGPGRRRAKIDVTIVGDKITYTPHLTAGVHAQSQEWWRERFADIADAKRRNVPRARSSALPQQPTRRVGRLAILHAARGAARNVERPDGVSRQLHRLAMRAVAKDARRKAPSRDQD